LKQPGLDKRHRDKDGEISRKHGNTVVATLRLTYGPHFAPDIPNDIKLREVLETLDEPSLSKLVADLEKKQQPAPFVAT
jgi:hypothetical protein